MFENNMNNSGVVKFLYNWKFGIVIVERFKVESSSQVSGI